MDSPLVVADRLFAAIAAGDVDAVHSGFVQQHVLRGTVGGTPIAIPACIVATVRDGRITRLDEYLDSAHVAALAAAAGRH